MRLYDRFKGVFIDSRSLPRDLDLGRYTTEDGQDLTNSIFDTGSEYYIHQELLNDANHSLHELFKDLSKRVSARRKGEMNIFPLIQTLEDKLEMNDFEIYLCEKIPHLEQICHQPHYLLQRIIEKVNASRAKRIPSKSYQYLAAHTEDWEQKSIVNFKPNRVLNEELDLNFNIYENQLFLALVERCLKYLNGRLKEVKDISLFIEKYKELLDKRNDTHAWFEKVSRNLTLIGGVYEDENYQKGKNDDQAKLVTTEEHLRAAYKRLLLIRSSDLFDEVNKRAAKNIMLRDTNVLINHKHYRYVRFLWLELNKIRPEKTEEDLKIDEQTVIEGLRAYAKTLFSYTVSHLNYNDNLNYEMEGSYSGWNALNDRLSPISFVVADDKTFEVTIGKWDLRFIVVGNISNVDTYSLPERTYLLCYSQDRPLVDDRVVLIDPMDPDSAERLGLVINRYLLSEYVSKIQKEYPYPQALRDFIEYIDAPWVHFFNEHNHCTYSFIKPRIPIDKKAISARLVVGRDIRDDQKKELLKLVDEIERNYSEYVSKNLYCFHCQTPFNENTLEDFKYMACPMEDGFVLDISQPGRIILKNVDDRYSADNVDWGLDCMDFYTDRF